MKPIRVKKLFAFILRPWVGQLLYRSLTKLLKILKLNSTKVFFVITIARAIQRIHKYLLGKK